MAANADEVFLFQPVGNHTRDNTLSGVTALNQFANVEKLMIQALGQNVRYVLDGSVPSATHGFRLIAGADPTIFPVSGASWKFLCIEEVGGAEIQYQWGQ